MDILVFATFANQSKASADVDSLKILRSYKSILASFFAIKQVAIKDSNTFQSHHHEPKLLNSQFARVNCNNFIIQPLL